MRVMHPTWDRPIDLDDGEIHILLVQSKILLVSYIEEMLAQSRGQEGRFIFYSEGMCSEGKEYLKMILDPFSLDVDSKTISNGIINDLLSRINGDVHYTSTLNLVESVNQHLKSLAFDLDVIIDLKEITGYDLVKLSSPKVNVSNRGLLDKICDYLLLLRRYTKYSVFVFVGVCNYLSEEDLRLFYEFIIYNGIRVLFIETYKDNLIGVENVTAIDEGLCVISNRGLFEV